MYLQALEISNFKSFKGEITIPLDRGFTAITGPNGSGKSNCGDAIQFVLGPRSNKVIRAQNAKDLIFNGGKNSKPARSCDVTLGFCKPLALQWPPPSSFRSRSSSNDTFCSIIEIE